MASSPSSFGGRFGGWFVGRVVRLSSRASDALGFVKSSRRGIRDVLTSLVPQGIRLSAGLASAIFLTRGLGPGGLGDYALAMSMAETAGLLSDLGIGQTGARYAARAAARGDRQRQMAVLRWAFRARMALAVVITTVMFALAPWFVPWIWGAGGLSDHVRLALPIGLFAALSSVPITYFQSEHKFGRNAAVQGGQSLLTLAGVVVLAVVGAWSVPNAIVVALLATGMGAAAFLFMVPRDAWWTPTASPTAVPASDQAGPGSAAATGEQPSEDREKVPTFAFFMLLSTLAVFITGKLDLWLIGHYLDKAQVGIYSAAGRMTLPLAMVLAAMNTVLWPRVAAATSLAATRQLARKTFKASALLAVAAVGYAVAGPLLAPYVFGPAYRSSVTVAQLLCLGYCMAILVCPLGAIGYNLGMVRLYWALNIGQFGVVLAILVPLLPRYGVLAGGLAFIGSISFGGAATGYLIWRRLREPDAAAGANDSPSSVG